MPAPRHSLDMQVREVEREIRMRREVYPRQVTRGKYRRGEADELIAIMEDVRESLIELQSLKQRRKA